MATRVSWWNHALAHLANDARWVDLTTAYADEGLDIADDLMTCYVNVVAGQQVSVVSGRRLADRLLDALNKAQGLDLALCLINMDEGGLREFGFSRSKALALKGLAQGYAQGFATREALDDLSDEAIADRLTRIKGIGPWSVRMILLFGLGRPDVFPSDDLGVRRGMQRRFGPDCDMEATARTCSPYRSAVTWLLWRTQTQTPVQY
ncbi:MAG: DNA-3-methyladenine glycosylase 2 family protein [Duodenibacillus sp.]|nr:DNA-3-methyladenine glycosylase 2 family protein [Duodenibacillus sp.]